MMKRIWEKEYTLRASDFDKYNRIKPSAVLELFQDAAGQHALELGVGFGEMIKRSYLWVLTRIKFKIISNPESYQTVVVKTWPIAPNRLCYRREYCIESSSGERLIAGSSEWVIMHSEKRRLIADKDLYPFDDGFCTELMFEERLAKARDFEAVDTPRVVNAGFSELDVNNHVNNTKYANYIMDAIAPLENDVLESFQIDYRKEVLEGTRLHIYHTAQENDTLAKGVNDRGDVMFACALTFKK